MVNVQYVVEVSVFFCCWPFSKVKFYMIITFFTNFDKIPEYIFH